MKILLLDIETAPNLAHVWGIWQQNVAISQIMNGGYTLCWAAKWLGDGFTYFDSLNESKPKTMLKNIYKMLEEADAVVHYNGAKFDIPTLNSEFIKYGLPPPAPFKQIDLLQVVKSRFRFPSNKLEYVVKALGLKEKTKHSGHDLWVKVMGGDKNAWVEMEEYNTNDVTILEELYYKLRPWIKGHANFGLYSDDKLVCTNCGSSHYHKRGIYITHTNRYQRYRCEDCGTWFRASGALDKVSVRKHIGVS